MLNALLVLILEDCIWSCVHVLHVIKCMIFFWLCSFASNNQYEKYLNRKTERQKEKSTK